MSHDLCSVASSVENEDICHACPERPNLWKLSWSCKQLHLLCLPDPWNLPARSFEIHWVRQYSVNIVLFWIKDLQMSEMIVSSKWLQCQHQTRKYSWCCKCSKIRCNVIIAVMYILSYFIFSKINFTTYLVTFYQIINMLFTLYQIVTGCCCTAYIN